MEIRPVFIVVVRLRPCILLPWTLSDSDLQPCAQSQVQAKRELPEPWFSGEFHLGENRLQRFRLLGPRISGFWAERSQCLLSP